MKGIPSFSWMVLGLFVLLLLYGCAEKESENKGFMGIERMEQELKSQIDWQEDDFLETASKDFKEQLTVDSFYYGNFTTSNANELLVLIQVPAPHVAGLNRTIAAIYDADTLKIKSQKTFAADCTTIFLLSDELGREYILFSGSVTYQGYTTYSIELLDAKEAIWVSKSIAEEPLEQYNAFAMTNNNILQVFTMQYDDHGQSVFQYKFSLFWDMEKCIFVR